MGGKPATPVMPEPQPVTYQPDKNSEASRQAVEAAQRKRMRFGMKHEDTNLSNDRLSTGLTEEQGFNTNLGG